MRTFNFFLYFFFTVVFVFTVGCQKSAFNDPQDNDSDLVTLKVDVTGMETPFEIMANVSKNRLAQQTNHIDHQITERLWTTFTLGEQNAINTSPKLASTTSSLPHGIKYFLLIYKYQYHKDNKVIDSATRTLEGYGIGTTGQSNSIQMNRPTQLNTIGPWIWRYEIIAFTYNDKSTEGFPNLEHLKGFIGKPFDYEVNIGNDRQFMISKSQYNWIKSTFNNNFVNIYLRFKAVMAKVTIGVDVSTIGAKIKELGGAITATQNINTLKLKIADSIYTVIPQQSQVNKVILNRMLYNTVLTGCTYNDANCHNYSPLTGAETFPTTERMEFSAYVYVGNESNFTNLGLQARIDHIKIESNAGVNKYTKTADSNPLLYTFNSLPIVNANNTIANIHFLEGYTFNNKIWAYGNLYFDKNARFKYKFRNDPRIGGQDYLSTDFWYLKKLIPNNYQTTTDSLDYNGNIVVKVGKVSNVGDPCRRVMPVNVWRLPTEQEFRGLIDNTVSTNKGRDINEGSNLRYTYIRNNNNELRLYYFGRFNGSWQNITGASWEGNYWISDGETVGDYAQYFYTGGNVYSGVSVGVQLSINRLNVRCVRDI